MMDAVLVFTVLEKLLNLAIRLDEPYFVENEEEYIALRGKVRQRLVEEANKRGSKVKDAPDNSES